MFVLAQPPNNGRNHGAVYCPGRLFGLSHRLGGGSCSQRSEGLCYLFQDGSVGNLDDLAQEYSQYYGTSLRDVCERMEEIRRRKIVPEAETVSRELDQTLDVGGLGLGFTSQTL